MEASILAMHDGSLDVETGVELILASRHLERIADLACNVAESVIYSVEGEVVRHKSVKVTGWPQALPITSMLARSISAPADGFCRWGELLAFSAI